MVPFTRPGTAELPGNIQMDSGLLITFIGNNNWLRQVFVFTYGESKRKARMLGYHPLRDFPAPEEMPEFAARPVHRQYFHVALDIPFGNSGYLVASRAYNWNRFPLDIEQGYRHRICIAVVHIFLNKHSAFAHATEKSNSAHSPINQEARSLASYSMRFHGLLIYLSCRACIVDASTAIKQPGIKCSKSYYSSIMYD